MPFTNQSTIAAHLAVVEAIHGSSYGWSDGNVTCVQRLPDAALRLAERPCHGIQRLPLTVKPYRPVDLRFGHWLVPHLSPVSGQDFQQSTSLPGRNTGPACSDPWSPAR